MSRTDPHVLVVDDDERLCALIVRALEPLADCDVAYSAHGALLSLQAQRYDAVLIDVALGDESGLVLLDEVRAMWPPMACVMISGLDDLSTARDALARGARGYIVKPFRIRDLRIQVAAALERPAASARDAHSSARAAIVNSLGNLLDPATPLACVVVDIAHLPLLGAVYGAEVVEDLTAEIERRTETFSDAVHLLGPLGPTSFVAAIGVDAHLAPDAARSLQLRLSTPLLASDTMVPVPCRIGLATAIPGESADAVLRRAEAATEAARDAGLPFVVSDGGATDVASLQFELLADVTKAIHDGQIRVVYQPQFALEDGRCVGLEALARWQHPDHGDVPASVFVPLAERMGLIGELDDFVLRQACRDRVALAMSLGDAAPRVAVNVSAAEMRSGTYAEHVQRVLRETTLPPDALTLEITESIALDNNVDAARTLFDLSARGVRLALDDFGTGYSSFARLTQAGWSELKVDRSHVSQHDAPGGHEMLHSMVALGHALGVDVVAEGVETPEQLEHIRALGFHFVQGYLLGRPAPLEELELRTPAA